MAWAVLSSLPLLTPNTVTPARLHGRGAAPVGRVGRNRPQADLDRDMRRMARWWRPPTRHVQPPGLAASPKDISTMLSGYGGGNYGPSSN
jgi:hypothetical protein